MVKLALLSLGAVVAAAADGSADGAAALASTNDDVAPRRLGAQEDQAPRFEATTCNGEAVHSYDSLLACAQDLKGGDLASFLESKNCSTNSTVSTTPAAPYPVLKIEPTRSSLQGNIHAHFPMKIEVASGATVAGDIIVDAEAPGTHIDMAGSVTHVTYPPYMFPPGMLLPPGFYKGSITVNGAGADIDISGSVQSNIDVYAADADIDVPGTASGGIILQENANNAKVNVPGNVGMISVLVAGADIDVPGTVISGMSVTGADAKVNVPGSVSGGMNVQAAGADIDIPLGGSVDSIFVNSYEAAGANIYVAGSVDIITVYGLDAQITLANGASITGSESKFYASNARITNPNTTPFILYVHDSAASSIYCNGSLYTGGQGTTSCSSSGWA